MRGGWLMLIAVSFAVTGLMFTGSGFNDAVGHSQDTSTIQSAVENESSDTALDEGISGDPSVSDDGTIVGFLVTGTRSVLDFLTLVVLLPSTLANLGFPNWFAYPIGNIIRIVASIAFVQFAIGRFLR